MIHKYRIKNKVLYNNKIGVVERLLSTTVAWKTYPTYLVSFKKGGYEFTSDEISESFLTLYVETVPLELLPKDTTILDGLEIK